MRIAVKDSSILIDLAEADLLGLWIQLKIETHATDFVLHEVSRGQQWAQISPFVDAGLLQRHAAYSERIRTLIPIQSGHRSGGFRTAARFNSDSVPIQIGQHSGVFGQSFCHPEWGGGFGFAFEPAWRGGHGQR